MAMDLCIDEKDEERESEAQSVVRARHVSDMFWTCFGHVLDIFWIFLKTFFGHFLDICWTLFES